MEIIARLGDTYTCYSEIFKVPLNVLKDANPEHFIPGQTIYVPGYEVENYRIKNGDTLQKLAEMRDLTVDSLLSLNPFLKPDNLEIDHLLQLPKRIVTHCLNRKTQYDFDLLQKDILLLKSQFPFLQINTIGESVLGNPIQEITIGRGRVKIQANASFHANEWITTPVLMNVLNDYCLAIVNSQLLAGTNASELYDCTTFSIIPMVNPDGVDLVINGLPHCLNNYAQKVVNMNKGETDFSHWKANIRGVDLNDQFPAKWEIEKSRNGVMAPGPRDFSGEHPLTEPEAVIMKELAERKQYDLLMAFHTQGQEFYWGFEGFEPPESERLAEILANVSGYEAIRYVESYGGYKDWFIQEFKRPAFTIELGHGVNPLPLTQFDEMSKVARKMIIEVLKWRIDE